MFSNLVQMKTLLMVVTAAVGTVGGGVLATNYAGTITNKSYATFLLSLDPATITIGQSTNGTSTLTVMSVNGYTGTVALTLYYPGTKFSSTVSPASVTVPANGQAHSTVTVAAPSAPGTYSLIVIGTAVSHGKTSYSTSMLTVQVMSSQDFTISSSLAIINNSMGSTNTTVITVASLNGYTGNVSLTVTAPFGYITVTGSQNMLALESGTFEASSTLTINTSLMTALGTYTIIVTATDGVRTHTATILLNVLDPVPVEQLVGAGYQFVNGTDLHMSLQNIGNVSLTLQSYTVQDTSGDGWTMNNWAGPTINQTTTATATILIGSSCPTCNYSGITGLFFQFQVGHTYTVTLTTARGTQFSFTVTR
jgi:hypothetical protein